MRYIVTIPVAGYATMTVEAADETEAIDEAVDIWDGDVDYLEALHVISKDTVDVPKATAEPADVGDSDDDD